MAKKIIEKKKEKWSIEEIFKILEKEGMEIYSFQEMRRQINQYDYEAAWAVFICKEKVLPLAE